jgi:DNA-directed RNA polymerase specialized sigma24 family protein
MTESNSSPESMLAAFDRYRPLLFSIAYRMLGSVADAEYVVQEAYLRWQQASDIRSPNAYLSTVVTRLSLDHLRKAPPGFVVRRMRINGRLGLVGYFEDGSPHSVTTLDVAEDRVRAIRLVVNPEKLGGVLPLDRAEIVEGPR